MHRLTYLFVYITAGATKSFKTAVPSQLIGIFHAFEKSDGCRLLNFQLLKPRTILLLDDILRYLLGERINWLSIILNYFVRTRFSCTTKSTASDAMQVAIVVN